MFTFIVAVLLAVLALLFVLIPSLGVTGTIAFWVLLVAFGLLALGNLLKGL